MKQTEKMYMNAETGSVDNYKGWDYENENGETVNAVELGEVFEVVLNDDGDWVEGEFMEEKKYVALYDKYMTDNELNLIRQKEKRLVKEAGIKNRIFELTKDDISKLLSKDEMKQLENTEFVENDDEYDEYVFGAKTKNRQITTGQWIIQETVNEGMTPSESFNVYLNIK